MYFKVVADTDIGIYKQKNQDSLLVKHALHPDGRGEILLAVLCDGMGGLCQGEWASAVVIEAFAKWFDEDLWKLAKSGSLQREFILEQWGTLLERENRAMRKSRSRNDLMGTTCTAALFFEDMVTVIHIGDTRLYALNEDGIQLTTDHTFVAGEMAAGRMTPEEAAVDRRRNLLTQCVGASTRISPQRFIQPLVEGTYLLCSDGFRHEVSLEEMKEKLGDEMKIEEMKKNIRHLIEMGKQRGEKDNISAIVVQAECTDKGHV